MRADEIQQGDQCFDGDGNLVWTVLWNPMPFDRERTSLRLLWAHDQGETDRAYRNEVELNIVRPTPPPEDPPPEDPPVDPEEPPAEDPPPPSDPETPPEEPPVDPTPLEQGENTVTPDPPAEQPPAEG